MKKTTKINTEKIKALNPCQSRFDNYLTYYYDFNGDLLDFILLKNITYDDKVWVVTRLFTKEQNIKWSILCAEKVLDLFENKFPSDLRPRLALEAAVSYINNQTEDNRVAAYAAANAAYAAYAANAAAYAAYAAAANAAAYAAYAAAANAAYANAAYAASTAISAAYAAANDRLLEEEVNLLLMLECLD